MWVVADVYEPDVPKIRLGQAVVVTLPCCPGDRYEGRVVNISDAVDKETRTLKVRAVVPNRDRSLKAEMFVKVAIDTGATRVLSLRAQFTGRAARRSSSSSGGETTTSAGLSSWARKWTVPSRFSKAPLRRIGS